MQAQDKFILQHLRSIDPNVIISKPVIYQLETSVIKKIQHALQHFFNGCDYLCHSLFMLPIEYDKIVSRLLF